LRARRAERQREGRENQHGNHRPKAKAKEEGLGHG
jgi:hypothetical protein